MLPLVLILLLVFPAEWSLCQGDIVFPIDANEGQSCELANGQVGHCRKVSECATIANEGLVLCRSNGRQVVVCCDDVHDQCNAINVVSSNVRDHVVGDTDKASVGEFPFMALVTYNNTEKFCGASIISDRFLLTAAHCFLHDNATSVRLGTTEVSDDLADTIPIAQIHRHSRYRPLRRSNDIALIELQRSITMNSNVAPICLYTEDKELPATQNLTVIGWGRDNSENPSKVLLKGNVAPVVRADCQQRFDKGILRINITDGHMCALGEQSVDGKFTDACQGDSGGPLVMKRNNRFYLVGVVSTGPSGCGNADLAGIYTWVSKYVKWVAEHRVWRQNP